MSNPAPSHNLRSIVSWTLYDFANSAFTTLVVTFVYATYFTRALASDEVTGTELWSRGVAITSLTVALLSPFVGAIADRGGYRKLFLAVSTLICIAGTTLLYFIEPGQVVRALVTFVVANIAFEMGYVFYNAYLPDIAPVEKIGRISGYGWGLGYIGGLLCLFTALFGFIDTDTPLFGFSPTNGENVRATNLLVAVWFFVFSLPLFFFVRERDRNRTRGTENVLVLAARQFKKTLSEVRHYRQVFRLLIAHLVYNDGLVTVFAFGGIYAAGTFGFTFQQITIFGIVLNLAAGLGAFLFGFLDDRIGGRRTILISLVGLTAAVLLAVFTRNTTLFWVAGILIGLLSGPNQSASRSLMGRFTPADKENEFYGFFALSGRATAFLGPFLLGQLTRVFESQRAGIAIVLLFFLAGFFLLLRVDEQEGQAVAAASIDYPEST